jgi:hypothetical protein
LIKASYEQGAFVVEMRNNRPVRAYQKPAHEIRGSN